MPDRDIDVAIVIEAAESTSAAGVRIGDARPGFVNQLFESAITQVPKHQAWSAKRVSRNLLFHFGVDTACGHEEIGEPVIIQISHASAPSYVARFNPQSRVNRHVIKVSFTVIVIE